MLVFALAVGGLAACGDNDENSTPSQESAGEITMTSTPWVKGTRMQSTPHTFEAVEGETFTFPDMGSTDSVGTIDSVSAESVTVSIDGTMRTTKGIETDPTFTIEDGSTITFETASEDAGIIYEITFEAADS